MRRFLGILLVFSILAPSVYAEEVQSAGAHPTVAAQSSAAPNLLLNGTPVKLRLIRELSSAKAEPGDRVEFEVVEEVQVNGVVVIASGAAASGTVTEAYGKSRMSRGGKLELKLTSVQLADNETAAITATAGGKGDRNTGAIATARTSFLVLGVPALYVITQGKDFTIPEGTGITAYVDGDVPLDMAKLTPLQAALRQKPVGEVPITELTVASVPDGADVELDNVRLGSTSLTVRVRAGDHTVRIAKEGYQIFRQTLTTYGGSLNITAELKKN